MRTQSQLILLFYVCVCVSVYALVLATYWGPKQAFNQKNEVIFGKWGTKDKVPFEYLDSALELKGVRLEFV